jgi:hypothetical protein
MALLQYWRKGVRVVSKFKPNPQTASLAGGFFWSSVFKCDEKRSAGKPE